MKITNWPSTHVNLVTGWALFVGTVLIGWYSLVKDVALSEWLYTTLLIATGVWAGVAAPAALIGKRATTKPELTVTVEENGPPPRTTTTTVMPPQAEGAADVTLDPLKPTPPEIREFVRDEEVP